MTKKTAGQRWLAKRMKSPTFAAAFKKERMQIDVVDAFIRATQDHAVTKNTRRAKPAQKIEASE